MTLGLQSGDVIVTAGTHKVKEGESVKRDQSLVEVTMMSISDARS